MKIFNIRNSAIFILLSILIIVFGDIWYNTYYIKKIDSEYSSLVYSSLNNSNSLSQTNINTAIAMNECYLLVLAENNINWDRVINNLDSIKRENSILIESLKNEVNNESQKEKLNELISLRKRLISERNYLVDLVKNNKKDEAKMFFIKQFSPSFSLFYKESAAYLNLIKSNIIEKSSTLSKKSIIIRKLNLFLFWAPIITFSIIIIIILVVLYKLIPIRQY